MGVDFAVSAAGGSNWLFVDPDHDSFGENVSHTVYAMTGNMLNRAANALVKKTSADDEGDAWTVAERVADAHRTEWQSRNAKARGDTR